MVPTRFAIARPPWRQAAQLLLAACALALGVAACAPLTVLNGLVPDGTHRRVRDLAYGHEARQRLDLYLPATDGASPRPVVVFFYGGGWTSGERADYRFAGEAFASAGYVTVVPDYRLHPQVRYPDFLADCAAAVAWVQRNISRHGGDPRRIVLAGHSAGAYNAAMLALAPGLLENAGADRAAIRGLIGLAGPYDFLPLTGESTRAVFGYPETPPDTQPVFHLRSPMRRPPPALLLFATTDPVVSPGNSARLAAALRAAGATAEEIGYAGLDHRSLVGALAAPLRALAPVREDALHFLARVSREPT